MDKAGVRHEIQKIIAWQESDEGKKEINKAMIQVCESMEMLEKERQLDYAIMYEPLGPVSPNHEWPLPCI